MRKSTWWQRCSELLAGRSARKSYSIPRKDHGLSRRQVSRHALTVMRQLNEAGYKAYLVGGGVRDVLAGMRPKDFDVVTDALPEEVKKLFRRSRLIGRRFRLVHVYFSKEVIEVSTFRAAMTKEQQEVHRHAKKVLADNVYGTEEEDAWRRDFTVNALYYSVKDFSIIDYTNGMDDLKAKVIRMIGDPEQRFHEDPIRLLRAIRLAAKLNFTIEKHMHAVLVTLVDLLNHVPKARVYDELLKMFFQGHAESSYRLMQDNGFFAVIFSKTTQALLQLKSPSLFKLIEYAMRSTDERVTVNKPLSPGFLFAVLLWPQVIIHMDQHKENSSKLFFNLHHAINNALNREGGFVSIPKRFNVMMRQMWLLQFHLDRRRIGRAHRVVGHRYFRAAIDFFVLRAEAGEVSPSKAHWWQAFAAANKAEREEMLIQLEK